MENYMLGFSYILFDKYPYVFPVVKEIIVMKSMVYWVKSIGGSNYYEIQDDTNITCRGQRRRYPDSQKGI